MVVLGRPKGDPPKVTLCERGSYQQWKENNIPPQVVFEVLSPGNTQNEIAEQRAETAEARAVRLAEHLRSLGIDPDQV